MSWLFFALGAPVSYAISNFIDRFLIEKRIRDNRALAILSGITGTVISLTILISLRFPAVPWRQAFIMLASGACGILGLIPYYRAIAMEDASRVVPLFQLSPVFTFILSALFLHEMLTGTQFLGFFLIVAGGLLLAAEKLQFRGFRLRKAYWYAVLTSLIFAFPNVLFKYVSLRQNFWITLAYDFLGAALAAFLLMLTPLMRRAIKSEWRNIKTNLGILGANEIIYAAGIVSGFYAINLASPSLVSALGRTQSVFVLIFGLVLSIWFPHIIKEDLRGRTVLLKLVAIALMFWGVWVIS